MSKSIKLKNDIYFSRDAIGETLFSGSIGIGKTQNVTGLSKYRVLEFWYSRGTDYGSVIHTCLYQNKHTSASIMYTSTTRFVRRTANIYWNEDSVEFRNVLNESEGSYNFDTIENNYDKITKIVGYN